MDGEKRLMGMVVRENRLFGLGVGRFVAKSATPLCSECPVRLTVNAPTPAPREHLEEAACSSDR
jgi:hypothetical protein